MSATSSSSFPLATEDPYTGPGSSDPDTGIDNDSGASGSSNGSSMGISHGGLIAIIVVVVGVAAFGIVSSVLFYLAKKREWKVREHIRRSTRKVVQALTPHRSEFPRSVKGGHSGHSGHSGHPTRSGSSKGRVHMDDVPPTPHLPVDLEKGLKVSYKKAVGNFSRK